MTRPLAPMLVVALTTAAGCGGGGGGGAARPGAASPGDAASAAPGLAADFGAPAADPEGPFLLPDVSPAWISGNLLVAAKKEPTERATRLTLEVARGGAVRSLGVEPDAPWRGFLLPRDVGTRAGGSLTPVIDLSDIRVRIRREESGAIFARIGTQAIDSLDALSALGDMVAQQVKSGSGEVTIDAAPAVPVRHVVATAAVVMNAGRTPLFAATAGLAVPPSVSEALAGATGDADRDADGRPEVGLRLRADARARWSAVAPILEAASAAGVSRLTFVTRAGEVELELFVPFEKRPPKAPRSVATSEIDRELEAAPERDTGAEKPIIILEEEIELSQPDEPTQDGLAKEGPANEKKTAEAFSVGGGVLEAYADRFAKKALEREGGSERTEVAVEAALDWLARHQSDDGRWSVAGWRKQCEGAGACKAAHDYDGAIWEAGAARYDAGLTALGLLAFLGNGHTHRFGKHKRVVHRGLLWLRQQQKADGSIGFSEGEEIYNHALATVVLCEAYGISRDFTLKKYAERAVAFCLKAQNPGLGWKYGVKPGRNDTSVTVRMVIALWSAKQAGLGVPESTFEGARAWLDRATASSGETGYQTPGGGSSFIPGSEGPFDEQPTMTAAAILGRLLAGEPADADAVQRSGRIILERPPAWPTDGETAKVNFYYWHHGTSAAFHVGGATWKRWNASLQAALLPRQRTDGDAKGSWDPVGPWCIAGGRVYATAINALTLEVYYREARVGGR